MDWDVKLSPLFSVYNFTIRCIRHNINDKNMREIISKLWDKSIVIISFISWIYHCECELTTQLICLLCRQNKQNRLYISLSTSKQSFCAISYPTWTRKSFKLNSICAYQFACATIHFTALCQLNCIGKKVAEKMIHKMYIVNSCK